MENASKALIIAGSVLITIMIISVAVYVFKTSQNFTLSVTSSIDETVVEAFNANLSIYQTLDGFDLTTNRYIAASELNTISEVVTAINFAVSINDENNYSYKYTTTYGVETSNAVEVYIDMTAAPTELQSALGSNYYSYYLIEPNSGVTAGYVYGFSNPGSTRAARLVNTQNSFTTSNRVSCNKLMSLLNESKLVSYLNENYTVYKYYFEGDYEIDDVTRMINSVQFKLVVDTGFDSL